MAPLLGLHTMTRERASSGQCRASGRHGTDGGLDSCGDSGPSVAVTAAVKMDVQMVDQMYSRSVDVCVCVCMLVDL